MTRFRSKSADASTVIVLALEERADPVLESVFAPDLPAGKLAVLDRYQATVGAYRFMFTHDRSGRQGCNAWQPLAFHPFEKGAARSGNIGEVVLDTGVGQRRDGVAAASDGDELAFLR